MDPSQHEEVWRSSQRLELLTVFLSRMLSSPPHLFLPVFLLFLLPSHRACLLSPIMSGALMMGLRWFSHSLEGVGRLLEWKQTLSVLPFAVKTSI